GADRSIRREPHRAFLAPDIHDVLIQPEDVTGEPILRNHCEMWDPRNGRLDNLARELRELGLGPRWAQRIEAVPTRGAVLAGGDVLRAALGATHVPPREVEVRRDRAHGCRPR